MAAPVVMHPLEPLCEGWQRGLAIVAHPDDLEFGAAAAIARWTGQGKQSVYCLVTSGEAGIDTMAPAQAGWSARRRVAYLGAADNVSRLLPSPLRNVTQPVIRSRNAFSRPQPVRLACL